jgi:hypothetical protein
MVLPLYKHPFKWQLAPLPDSSITRGREQDTLALSTHLYRGQECALTGALLLHVSCASAQIVILLLVSQPPARSFSSPDEDRDRFFD